MAQKRQRVASSRVADARLHDRGGQHPVAVQSGQLLVRDAVGGASGRRTGAGRTGAGVDGVDDLAVVEQRPSRIDHGLSASTGSAIARSPTTTWPSSLGPAPAPRRTGAATQTPRTARSAAASTESVIALRPCRSS